MLSDPWRHWAATGLWSRVLWPMSVLYCALAILRRRLYTVGVCTVQRLPVPVIVVGNVTVGGTGKTPFVLWLCARLSAAGLRPGIVLRGYGGRNRGVLRVDAHSDPGCVGDEAVLLARHAPGPVIAARDRVAGAQALVEAGCDVIVADDGLQHYRLGRCLEIGILDGVRRFGNGLCLPGGPLREPRTRWDRLDFRVTQGQAAAGEWAMGLAGDRAYAVGGHAEVGLADLRRVHAVAGIGHPQRFFRALEGWGLEVIAHPFPDHHRYSAEDLQFDTDDPVVMTEKDAVKCESLGRSGLWYVPVRAVVDEELARRILARLKPRS
ncbi:tetraacyldisaccharide 4'-kinase [Acidiferrobacter thiooxydans]|uniref:tetraacyldisaccharide 4'-kinase n=1 Tax=Acidiferrobacter thiooxydans TaxID=163359 RepID=UPI002279094E|nr:tetraacyldisaccharide 4'-kinase [Acidiferrobacter thiooxydans]MDA8191092.1 tetraacyldisaccharide 4'-kinase [Gammaproteobacteria bacterium]